MWNNLSPHEVYARLDPAAYDPQRQLIAKVALLQPRIDQQVVGYIAAGLDQAGLGADDMEHASLSLRLEQQGIEGAKQHWIELLHAIVRRFGDVNAGQPPNLDGLRTELPFYEIELELIQRCGESLPALIDSEGTSAIVPLLFSDDLMRRWYWDSLTFRVYNVIARDAVAACLQDGAGQLRVLEVGAGTGGMTQCLLDLFPAPSTEYVFTDVGAFFLRAGRRRFAEHPFVKYQLYDLERPAAPQQLEPGSFDLVVANNVLHDTKNIRQTLANVSELLTPGGMLLMLELTDPQIWWHMCFGSLEGWWRFKSDPTDCRTDLMLLGEHQWRALLGEAGFAETSVLSDCLRHGFANQLFLSQLGRS